MGGRNSNAAQLFLGRGKLFADVWTDAGVSTGEEYLGVASVYEPQAPADETVEMRDYAVADAPLLDKIAIRRSMTMKATIHQITLEALRMVLLGTISAKDQGAASAVDEDVVALLGKYVALGFSNVKASTVVVEPASTGSPYTVDEDYTIDATTGRLYFMTLAEGGTITEAEALHVSYDYAADVSRTLAAGAALKVEGSLRFIGDPKRGQRFHLQVWHFQITPEGGIGLISDELGNVQLTFDVLGDVVNHPDEPYYLINEYTEYVEPEPET
jgi:hypothetical protein